MIFKQPFTNIRNLFMNSVHTNRLRFTDTLIGYVISHVVLLYISYLVIRSSIGFGHPSIKGGLCPT